MLLNRFNEKRIDDLAKTLNMSFGLQVLFFDLIMKNKQIGHNNDTLRDNSSIMQVNSPKNTSKSKINKKPNQDSNDSMKSIKENIL